VRPSVCVCDMDSNLENQTRRPDPHIDRIWIRFGEKMSMLLLLLAGQLLLLPLVAGGSCREAQLCCTGRDSSCVVQKAPINAIIEDLSDKPCYCDHACLKLGDCCDDFKDHCGGKCLLMGRISSENKVILYNIPIPNLV